MSDEKTQAPYQYMLRKMSVIHPKNIYLANSSYPAIKII